MSTATALSISLAWIQSWHDIPVSCWHAGEILSLNFWYSTLANRPLPVDGYMTYNSNVIKTELEPKMAVWAQQSRPQVQQLLWPSWEDSKLSNRSFIRKMMYLQIYCIVKSSNFESLMHGALLTREILWQLCCFAEMHYCPETIESSLIYKPCHYFTSGKRISLYHV